MEAPLDNEATFLTSCTHYSAGFSGASAEEVNDQAWKWIRNIIGTQDRAIIRRAPAAERDPDLMNTWSTVASGSVPRTDAPAQSLGKLQMKERANG